MRRLVINETEETEIFKRNIAKFTKATYDISNMPGIDYPNKWLLVYSDAMLTLLKHFKKKYVLKGNRNKMLSFMDQIGVEKNVRLSSVYSPYRVIRTGVVNSKFNNYNRLPRVFQYNNKFLPFDREDLHLMTVDVIKQTKLIGPCMVIDFSGATREDIGNPLGDTSRMERVFKFLEVPHSKDVDKEIKDTDADGNKLTQYQLDLFEPNETEDSVEMGFRTPYDTEASIKKLELVDSRAHKVRATLLMIQRVKATLENTKDKKKVKNLKKSLVKWLRYKSKIIDKK